MASKLQRKKCSYCGRNAILWDRSTEKYACSDHDDKMTRNVVAI